MIKRRAQAIGLPEEICNHTFRATGITAYLENGDTIEHAQQTANHENSMPCCIQHPKISTFGCGHLGSPDEGGGIVPFATIA